MMRLGFKPGLAHPQDIPDGQVKLDQNFIVGNNLSPRISGACLGDVVGRLIGTALQRCRFFHKPRSLALP